VSQAAGRASGRGCTTTDGRGAGRQRGQMAPASSTVAQPGQVRGAGLDRSLLRAPLGRRTCHSGSWEAAGRAPLLGGSTLAASEGRRSLSEALEGAPADGGLTGGLTGARFTGMSEGRGSWDGTVGFLRAFSRASRASDTVWYRLA